jgi:hypothetical protein
MIQRPPSGGSNVDLSRFKSNFNSSKYDEEAKKLFGGFTPYNPPSSSYYRELGMKARQLRELEKAKKEEEKKQKSEILSKYQIDLDESTSEDGSAFAVKSDDYFSDEEKEKKKKDNKDEDNFFGDLKAAGKSALQFFNPFDDVSGKEAVENFMKRDFSDDFKETDRFTSRAVDSASLGAFSNLDKKVNNKTPDYVSKREFGEGGGVDMLSTGLGYLVPGVGAYKALNATKAGKGLTQFGSKGIGQRLGSEASKGALTGLGLSSAEVGIREGLDGENYTSLDNLKHIGLSTGLGAVADPALYGISKVLGNSLKGIIPNKTKTGNIVNESSLQEQPHVQKISQTLDDFKPDQLPKWDSQFNPLGFIEKSGDRSLKNLEIPKVEPPSELGYFKPLDEWINFSQQGQSKSRPLGMLEPKQNQQYWQSRYEDFVNFVNKDYDPNQLNKETLDELWTQFAKYDEPVNLEQLVDLAYPKGVDSTKLQQSKLNAEANAKFKGLLNSDPRIRDGIKALTPPRRNPMKQIPEVEMLDDIFQKETLGEGLEPGRIESVFDSILRDNTSNVPFKSAESFEPITPLKYGTKLARVKDPITDPPDLKFNTVDEALDSFRSKVDREPKNEKRFENLFQKLRTQFVDDLAPLENLEKSIKGKVDSAENSLYKTGRLFRGSPAKANEIVKNELQPIIKGIEDKGYSYKDLGDYALAVHAKDVNEQGIKSGFSNAEIEGVINKLGTPEMEAARKQLMQVSDNSLKRLVDSGIISQNSFDIMKNKWENYMPLFRSFDDEKVEFSNGLSNALANASSPIKKLEGSDRRVIDPIESMVKNIFQTTNVADRNAVATQLGSLSKLDSENKFIRQLEPNEEVGRKNVVSVMEKGEKVRYEVPPEVYETMLNLDKESSNLLIKILHKPASTLRAGATLTPEFSLRNPMRDVAQAYVVSNSGFNPVIDFPVGLWNAIFKDKSIKVGGKEFNLASDLYEKFVQDNGGFGNIVSMDRDVHRKAVESVIKQGNTKKFINVFNPNTYVDILRTIADVSETATKLGEYRAATRKGVSREEAAYRARDIMDFGRSGVSIREANKVVAFLNANIQGKSKLIRAIQEDPLGVTARSSKAVLLPTVGAFIAQKYMANDEQKKVIEDAPNWLKDTFWLIPIPETTQVARIPKPFDLAPIFANLPEKALNYIYNNAKDAFDGFARETISSYSVPVMLTGLAPIIEGMANYSFFRQGAIIPQREQDMEFSDQYDINTSETAKTIGKGINKLTGGQGSFKNFGSPRIIDNTIRGLTGGLGEYTVDAIDAVLNKTGTVERPEKPEKQVNQQPVLRSFLVNQGSTGESVNKLYNLREKLTKERGSANQNEGYYNNESLYDEVNDVTKAISDISKEMRRIENDPELSGEEKRRLLDKLNEARNEVARGAIKFLQEGQ